jgi:hypothetical protein
MQRRVFRRQEGADVRTLSIFVQQTYKRMLSIPSRQSRLKCEWNLIQSEHSAQIDTMGDVM